MHIAPITNTSGLHPRRREQQRRLYPYLPEARTASTPVTYWNGRDPVSILA